MKANDLPQETPDSFGEFAEAIMGLSHPVASYDAVYDRLEAGDSLDDVLEWHCKENLSPKFPNGLETAKVALTAAMRLDQEKMVIRPCGKCGKMAPAIHTADTMVLHPFVRFLIAKN